ncbi:MAG: response regulator [Gammaproteobacteria bacterium]|nr:response regulator [Gammaproteobacteria bacterium]
MLNKLRSKSYVIELGVLTLLLIVGLLAWIGKQRLDDFESDQQNVARNTVAATANNITRFIVERHRLVNLFVSDRSGLIEALALTPKHKILNERLARQAAEHFSGYTRLAVTGPGGKPLSHVGGLPRRICQEAAAAPTRGRLRIHPELPDAHFDIAVPWEGEKRSGFFLIVFRLNPLVGLLKREQTYGHQLFLRNRNIPNLIITARGVRNEPELWNVGLRSEQVNRIPYIQVGGSRWKLIARPVDSPFRVYSENTVWDQSVAILFIFTAILMSLLLIIKHKERKLKGSEARFRAIVQDQTELICRFTPNGILTFVNLAYCRYFGKKEEELLGHRFAPEIFDEDREYYAQRIAALTPRLPVTDIEYRVVLPNGKVRWQQWVNRAMFDRQGWLVETQQVGRDITESKKTEADLQRAKEAAEAAARAKSDFLTNMGHEIRTPMNAILGLTELLLHSRLEEEQHGYAQTIHHSAKALLTLLSDILDFSVIEADQLTLDPKPVDMEAVVAEVARLMVSSARDKNLELIFRYSPDAPRCVAADAARIRQVLIALVSNAVKFTEDGYILISVTGRNGNIPQLEFSVEDTGIGIEQKQLVHIFEEFAQADTSATRRYGGVGLGLTIAHALVTIMNGQMQVVSEPGQGSTFRFTLSLPLAEEAVCNDKANTAGHLGMPVLAASGNPINRPVLTEQLSALQMRNATASTEADTPKLRILAVDDNETNRMVAVNMLEQVNCQTDTAENGYKAVDILEKTDYDIVLMDIQMPEMDGYEVTRRIREREGTKRHTPVIAVTANTTPGAADRCLAAGMDEYIAKPLTLEHIRMMVKKYAGQSAQQIAPRSEEKASEDTANTVQKADLLPVFDEEQLRGIVIGNLTLLKNVVMVFTEDTAALLTNLETNLKEEFDPQTAERLFHSLKGESRNVGAQRLGEIAYNAEQAVKQKDYAAARALIPLLLTAFAELQTIWDKTDWDTFL